MPSENPPQLAKEPNRWRQSFLYWLSPILLASLGIHGLALLVPLPERNEVIEQEVVPLPDPISVTTLPPAPEPTVLPPEVFIPEPPPAEVVPAEPPPPATPIEPEIQQPAPAPPAQEVTQEPTPAQTTTPTQEPTQAPAPATEVNRSLKGTSQSEATQNLFSFIQINTLDPDNPLAYEPIRTQLELIFPSDRYCLKTVDGEPATESDTSVIVLIEKFTDGSLDWNDGQTVQLTGYKNVDAWVDQTLFAAGEEAPNTDDAIEIPDTPDFDIVQWLSDNAQKTLFEEAETEKAFLIPVNITFSNNCQ
ncbi:MAG: hypothetical protein AAF703_02365 [Cyanobacteria bacterium P01_D01_bin.105]